MKGFEEYSKERKKDQEDGLFPEWYTTQSYMLFKKKYSVPGENGLLDRHKTIAKTLAQYTPDPYYWEDKFFEIMWRGWLSPATPVLANTGTDRGMNVSCSGQYVGDSVDSFYKNRHEAALLGKNGFGCSAYFGDIRPRGEPISKGGTADGPVPVIMGFARDASEISQGSQRRGSIASYLPIDHPDFYELQNNLLNRPDGLNIGWCVSDDFVNRLVSGDQDANQRFKDALYTKLVTGRGYFMFVDKANRHRPQMYKDHNLDIKASNLCVAPETKILTTSGYVPIAEIEDESVAVWNGKEWSEVTVRKTGENQKLVKVVTDSGYELECTPYHKFYIFNGDDKEYKEVRANELKPGDKLAKFDTPVVTGGEGTKSLECRLDWLGWYLDRYGYVTKEDEIIIFSYEKNLLKDIQLTIQTLGASSKITQSEDHSWELAITKSEIHKLLSLGMSFQTIDFPLHYSHEDDSFVKVESVVDEGRVDDTYCFNEPKRHMGMFNGILTGQCSEIMLHSSEEYTYSCILSSMNVAKYDEWKDTDAVFTATVFLDALTSDFLEKSMGVPGLEKVRAFTEKGRALGLGVMGFSTYLQSKRMVFDDLETQFFNNELFKHIHDESLRASQWLAEEMGEPEWCKGYGVRNTHRTAIAPTKSTALLMGGVSESISPDPGMVFEIESAGGNMRRIVPEMYELMKERGVYSEETLTDIINHVGSVQHVSWLDDHEKKVFRTAFEVNQESILRYASQRQKYICQGQSLNFFVAEDGDEERIAQLHTDAFLDENILSLYYIYSRSGIIVNKDCESCSG